MRKKFTALLGLFSLCSLLLPALAGESLDLEGPWWFRPDRTVRRGQPNPHPEWANPDNPIADWSTIQVGTSWESQDWPGFDGVGWYRTQVTIPQAWEGSAIRLFAGRTAAGAETYWDGKSLGKKIGASAVNSFTLFPDQLSYGGEHTLVVRVWNWSGDGGLFGPDLRIERLTPPEPFRVEETSARSVSLLGEWWFKTDSSVGKGAGDDSKGWDEPGVNMEGWFPLRVGAPWETQGLSYNGVAWYRQTVEVPAEWATDPLFLELGKPDDGAEVYWNGTALGRTRKFGDLIQFRVPPELVRVDAPNTVAVRVWDWYQNGGLSAGTYALSRLAPIVPSTAVPGDDTLSLGITEDLEAPVVDGLRWKKGFRDIGTSDTRPRLEVAEGAFEGKDALRMEVWFPNSTEYMDARIAPTLQGYVWKEREYDYIRFRYRTQDLQGEMRISLNSGGFRWGGGPGTNWKSSFVVEPGGWTQVTIPFEAFTAKKGNKILNLYDTGEITTVSLGYANHELRGPGSIEFADVEVGRYALGSEAEPLELDGLWKFTLDKSHPDGERILIKDDRRYVGYGLEQGWHHPGFDDSDWEVVRVGDPWEGQGFSGWDGVGWYRQRFKAPAAWKDLTLSVNLGKADDEAQVFLNGEKVYAVDGKGEIAFKLDGSRLNTGGWNTLAVRVVDRSQIGGLLGGPFTMGPELFDLKIGFTESEERVDPEDFEFGAKPGPLVSMEFRFPIVLSDRDDLKVHARIVDCFHREMARVDLPLKRDGGDLVGILDLNEEQTRQLYYGEWFDTTGYVFSEAKGAVKAFASLENKMQFFERDTYALPPLEEEIWEDTPYGKLKLVDVIDPTIDPWEGPHPYKEGGIRASWVGRRAYATWKDGIKVSEYQGRSFREGTNNQFFGYRIGRELKHNTAYLVRILYPEDKTRYAVMDIKSGRNYMGTGFRTGISPDSPEDPWPLRGGYHWYDHLVMNDDVTYAHTGRRRADSKNGFWIIFHDPGRIYASAWESGPAVAEIRLYEVANIEDHYPELRFPEGLPRRSLMMDWEQEPRAVPYDIARWARFMGYTVIAPVFQKWASMGYYDTDMAWNVPDDTDWNTAVREGESNRDLLGNWLEGTAKAGIDFVPRVEYGGSPALPKEARAIGPNGRTAPAGRFASWGANLLHPATLEEFKSLIDEVVGRHIEQYPQITGLFWRMRNDRMMISFARQDVEMFARETGRDLPDKDDKGLAAWASSLEMADAYRDWWQRKRRDFHVTLLEYLKGFRPDLKLYYYNWCADGIYLGRLGKTPEDYTTFYNLNTSREVYEKAIAHQKTYTDQDYLNILMRGPSHTRPVMEPYQDVHDMVYYAPMHWNYLADAPDFLNHFRTGDGLAVSNIGYYEEKSRWNVQNDNYETSEMTPAGAPFSMAYEVLSVFHGDPYALTWTVYTPGRGFADAHRRFAQAYLALPAVTGEIVDATGDPEARARVYPGQEGESFLSVTYRGVSPRRIIIRRPSREVGRVVDLVTGEEIDVTHEGGVAGWVVDSPPMTLHSFRIEAP